MIGELIYSVAVTVVRCPGDGDDGANAGPTETPTVVRYCDVCRRWGANGSTHLCWRNWHKRLSDLLMDLSRAGGR
jgi:hypothetical protein